MTSPQNIIERIKDQLALGNISADEANIRMVEDLRFKIITNSLPRQVRKVLNQAVKDGRLTRIKKEGLKPEAYCKKDFEYLAKAERNKIKANALKALSNVYSHKKDLD